MEGFDEGVAKSGYQVLVWDSRVAGWIYGCIDASMLGWMKGLISEFAVRMQWWRGWGGL